LRVLAGLWVWVFGEESRDGGAWEEVEGGGGGPRREARRVA
jgi:hypothetical protein